MMYSMPSEISHRQLDLDTRLLPPPLVSVYLRRENETNLVDYTAFVAMAHERDVRYLERVRKTLSSLLSSHSGRWSGWYVYTVIKRSEITGPLCLDPFIIRQSVKIGFRMLPTRKQLDEAIFHGRKAELLDEYKTFIKTITQIYDTIEASYAERKYLQLP